MVVVDADDVAAGSSESGAALTRREFAGPRPPIKRAIANSMRTSSMSTAAVPKPRAIKFGSAKRRT